MVEWLDHHQGSVNAALVLLTIVLAVANALSAWFTREYVKLTREAVSLNQLQFSALQQRERTALRQTQVGLQALARRLSGGLAALPIGIDRAEDIRKALPWLDDDLKDLQDLSVAFGVYAANHAATVIDALRFFNALIADVRATRPGEFDWQRRFSAKRWPEYERNLGRAKESLERLVAIGSINLDQPQQSDHDSN